MLCRGSVCLRAIEASDLKELMGWRNNPKFRKFFREYREINSVMQNNWFENTNDNKNVIMFAIIDSSTKKLLGASGLCYIDWLRRSADFSIYIGYEDLYIDKKYAIDASRIMIEYAFDELNLHRLWAEIYSFDSKKIEMFESMGFSLDGRFRDSHWSEGVWVDSLYYSLLSTDINEK